MAGANLSAGATVSVTGPFTVSTDGTTYSTSVTLTALQLTTTVATITAPSIYVKFTPTGTTAATGNVTVAATGVTSQTVSLSGTGVASASLNTSVPSLSFGNVNLGTSSTLSYTLSGSNLGSVNTTIGATAPYTLSKSSTGPFTATLTFTPAELAATPSPSVYVQFSPTATGAANSSVTNTNTGVTSGPSVSVSGTGVVPVITATTSPVTTPTSVDFGNQTINNAVTKTFTVSGTNLIAGGITTVASTGNVAYTVSKTNGLGYAASITFSNAEMAANPTVYVQFLPTVLGATPGTILCSNNGTGATSATVNLTGTCVAAPVPVLSIDQSTLTAFATTVGTISVAPNFYTITGANITVNTPITVTTAAPYQISKDGIANWTTSFGFTNADFPLNTSTQRVYVRFSPTAPGPANGSAINAVATGATQTVTLTGTGLGVPLLTPSPTSLTFNQAVTTTSTVQSFTLKGDYLTAASTIVAVPTPYQVSKDGSTNWGSSVTYTSTDFPPTGTATINVYVRFSPTVIAAGGVNNGTASITSTGATPQSVTLNGTGIALPVITPSPTTVAFGNQSITAASAGAPVTLTATNTTANTTLTTSAPFGLSKTSAGPYTTSIFYTPTEMATAQTAYVNFAPTTTTASNGSVSIATTNATTQTVTLTGTGIPPPNVAPTLNAITDVTTCFTSTPQTIALSGISPGPEATQTVIVSVTSSNSGLFANLGVLPLTATTAQLNYTFAAGASGTAAVTVSVHDNGGTANGGVDTYTSTFNITVNAGAAISITASNGGAAVERGQSITLTATGGTTYTWTANNPNDIISQNGASIVVRPGTLTGSPLAPSKPPYTFTVSAGGCSVPQTFTINAFNATKLVTSNVITPNADGINDTWAIVNIELYPNNNVKVFDKAGKIVFSQSGYLNTWDGTYNGSPLTQGTYYYVVDLGGGTKYSGYISIVR